MTTRSDVRKILEGWGLTDRPEEYGDGIHGWRCEHPDRYGRCECFENAVTDIMELIDSEHGDGFGEGMDAMGWNE